MEITSEYLKTLYDAANTIFYQGELPGIPIHVTHDLGRWTVEKTHSEYYPPDDSFCGYGWSRLEVNINQNTEQRWQAEGIGPLTYPADLVAVMLHEMVHVYFSANGWAGKDGGDLIKRFAAFHSAAFAAEAANHGLCVYIDDDSLDVAQYIDGETEGAFGRLGVTICGMDEQRKVEESVRDKGYFCFKRQPGA